MGVTPLVQEVADRRKQTRRIGYICIYSIYLHIAYTHAIFTEDKSLIIQFSCLNKAVFTEEGLELV